MQLFMTITDSVEIQYVYFDKSTVIMILIISTKNGLIKYGM